MRLAEGAHANENENKNGNGKGRAERGGRVVEMKGRAMKTDKGLC